MSDGGDAPKPGDGYRIEIASVKRILEPLEESVVAARKIKNDWKPLSQHINMAATYEIVSSAEDVLSKWGYGMGRVASHTDTVVDTLRQVIAAYVLADLLGVKNFSPTEDNMAKLPIGEAGLKAWEEGARPKFDPPPEIYQEPWLEQDSDGKWTTEPQMRPDGTVIQDGDKGGLII